MNQKVTVVNDDGKRLFCVVSAQEDLEAQMKDVLGVTPGYGMTVEVCGDKIRLVDYFHGDTRATFTIVSREDTDQPVNLNWKTEE